MATQQILDKKLLNQFGKDYVKLIVELLKNNTISSRPGLPAYPKVASGKLINSIDYRLKETTEGIQFQLLAENYLQYVDKGRRPGSYPPIAPLKQWARIKGLPEGLAYGAQKNIYKFGIKPTNVLKRAQFRIETFRGYQERYEKGVVDQIVRTITKDISQGTKGFINTSIS